MGFPVTHSMDSLMRCAGTARWLIRTGVRFAGCGTLLLYRGPIPWDRRFDFMALTWVELWGFEPQTSCMPVSLGMSVPGIPAGTGQGRSGGAG